MSSTESQHQTYWCHECDMSIHLLSTTADPLVCPHCLRDHLEVMDNPTPTPTTTTDTNTSFLDSPSFRLFFLPLFNYINPSDDGINATLSLSIDSILPTIKITSSLLEGMDDDPVLLCAVCKHQFVIDIDAKLLPCNHLFHPDCILPWLNSNHNSCPLCRFQLPTPAKNDRTVVPTSDSSSRLSSTLHMMQVEEPGRLMNCTGSFNNVGMEMGYSHQDADDCSFPDVGVLSNYFPLHF
ncbi:hypothetical protein P3X46_013046 [Hevea brasiliensis]|uniref:RING-type E3 ubiquitin transferase n=1 Tax=Hevea brasiliensis TaxID=3981 RepID=A0ABQ9M673_HEVBR|nr:putative RING-H2 finger protein ATL62 [Hevea brasiliensis]XP_021652653.2 putative RING-H2 finger protein ATL62 [Hevea brasiliensis]KAJ9174399.1 hypothetical protein P3X46_013046 [Hevea brasiliensis]